MQRTTSHIQRDMLEWAKHHLYARATDEWGYDALEADPLVHLLVGACASEAKEVYGAIQSTEDRLFERLLRYLLPSAYHLPVPAVGIAQAKAKASLFTLPETQHLQYKEDGQAFTFTPVFPTTLVNGRVRFIGTDTNVLELEATPTAGQFLAAANQKESVSRFLIGIETTQPLTTLENVAFYLDWKGDDLEKRQLLQAFSNSTWHWNEVNLQRQNGFLRPQDTHWQDSLDAEKQLQWRVHAQYHRHFQLLSAATKPMPVEISVKDMLQSWLNNFVFSAGKGNGTTEKWNTVKGNFIWLRVQLPYAISLTDVERNLTLSINHFPVVNRTLMEKDDNDTFFTRSIGMEIVQIQAKKGLFQGIKSVVNQITNKPIVSMPLAQLAKDKRQAAYFIRMDGTGRNDEFNSWQRMEHMLGLFRQEHRQREVAERLGDKMSLEELHEVIGDRILKSEAARPVGDTQTPAAPPVYLFVQPGELSQQLRLKITYWITDGEAANHLKEGSKLNPEQVLAGLEPQSMRLVTTSNGAKNRRSTLEQGQVLQDTLFRRGRIVTAQDIKSLCYLKMGDQLIDVQLKPFFEVDRTPGVGGGYQRALDVRLKVKDSTDTAIQLIAQEIEWSLQENSIGSIPYKVRII
jgi:hypothetical protein